MGKVTAVLPLLRHSADPRLRSFIINWIGPLGADPAVLADELDHLPAVAKPGLAPGQSFMDAVLFHPETAQRRALILALGTYGRDGLAPGARQTLTAKLLDLYRNDPDSGIHGAAAWTLRQWGERKNLTAIDTELARRTDRGERRWFVNSQGQAFAVIEGPVEFRMGAPPTEPDRIAELEMLHRQPIPRRFAIAATEVSVWQFKAFLQDNPDPGFSDLKQFSSDPDGPQINMNWYQAAAYCNWLSRREGLPECYEPNPSGKYATGMKIKPDALSLGGYRLPTEAEWEYACRAGAGTSRYYGESVELLGRYAWYNANFQNRPGTCGSLLPNELGLFDMLGSLSEWSQDVRTENRGPMTEPDPTMNALADDRPRGIRGGMVASRAAFVRAAFHSMSSASDGHASHGFRLFRTYH
jgi:formylglycine-generating enzyme required for sulfatase activity